MGDSTPFQKEAWTEYAIGAVVLFLRYFARWRSVGFSKWQGDDVFAVLSLVFWTAELCMLELIGENGTNIGITDEMGAKLTPEEAGKLELGSKYLLAGWCCYVTLIWCLKGTMLCFFHRVTEGLRLQRVVKVISVLCVLAYIVMLAVILGHCQPVRKNWQVYPNPGALAVVRFSFTHANVAFFSTDALIVATPIPLLWKVKLTSGRKIAVGLLLCSGIFIMIATILRCVMSLHDIQGINVSTIWAIRETFIGIIAVNAAAIKPLFSHSKWMKTSLMRSKDGLDSDHSNNRSAARAYFSFSRRGGTATGHDGPYAASAAANLTHPMTAFGGGGSSSHWSSLGRKSGKGKSGDLVHSRNSSEEMIVPPGFEVTEIINNDVERGMGDADKAHHQQPQGGRQSVGTGGIMVTTTYHVE
ncbi:uncharacterized protein PG998_013428 [Apiospora kogelbergensis]|uniref:uncharacterized protein n=1 Tax=Apiospora kogelbergensis TaxID=1337665 RepID=UPI00312FB325